MARSIGTQDVSWFLDMYEKKQLDLNPPYQRRSVWSPRDKRYFIDTILNNYPAPPIFLHKSLDENGRSTYHVVDGKQRLQTIIDFSENKIRIPDDFAEVPLQKKRWKDIERSTRERFWNYSLAVEMLPDVSDSFIRNIFDRINRNSRKLMPQEMRHAKYDGWFIKKAEAESELKEWTDFGVVTPARMKRMADVQFISELLMVQILQRVVGFDHDQIDGFYAEYEDIGEVGEFVEDDFIAGIAFTKAYIARMLESVPDIKNSLKVQAHFYSLWTYLTLNGPRLVAAEVLAPAYAQFLSDVAVALDDPADRPFTSTDIAYARAVNGYAADTRGASTDTTPRENRHTAMVDALPKA